MTTRTLDMANVIASDVTISGDKTFSGDIIPSSPLSHRNLIINGAMQVAQRASSATQVSNAAYATLDRWKFWENTDGSYQSSQVDITDLPGFTKAMLLSPNSADTSIANSQYAFFGQLIEAQNLQHLSYSTSSAKTLTLSFYVKSNLTGKMTVYVAKYDNTTRIVPLEFDLPSSANTWERITLTVPALTESAAGVINNDNGMGLEFGWYLSAGSTYKVGTSGTWSSNSNGYSTANHNVNFMSSTDNNFYITGVQLELGDNATPFEHRSYAEELARCQRYFQAHPLSGQVCFPYDGQKFFVNIQPFVPMRSRSALTVSKTHTVARMTTLDVADYWVHGSGDYANGDHWNDISVTGHSNMETNFVITLKVNSSDGGLTDQEPVVVTGVNNTARNGFTTTDGFIHFSSEL